MGWGVNLMGYANVLQTLQDLKFRFDGNTVYVVGTSVSYAVYQEYGTSRMQAQPYLRPAVREVSNNMASIVGDAENEEQVIKKIALAVEREAKQNAPVDTSNLKNSIRAEKVK